MTKQEIHANICDGLKELYRAKNKDYGDSYAKVRDIIPTSILVRLHDKLGRATQLMLNKESGQEVSDESIEDTLRDLANYAILELVEREYERPHEDHKIDSLDLVDNISLPMSRLMPAFAKSAQGMLEKSMFGKDLSEMSSEEVKEYLMNEGK